MFKNIIQSLVTKGAVAVINFCILIISSKYLGVSSRGEISIFILNITIIQAINEVYTGYSIIHFIPRFSLKKIILNGIIYTLIFCSLSNALIVFIHKQVSGYEWLGYLCSMLVILNTFFCVIILGRENIKLYNLLSFLQPFLLLVGIAVYVFGLKQFTFASYFFPLLISFILATLISTVIVLRIVFAGPQKRTNEYELRSLLINGFVFQANVLMYVFCNRYSYYLLPSSAKVGLYASASVLTESVLIIVNGIAPVLISKAANKGNSVATADLALALSKLSFLFSCMAMALVLFIPEHVYIRMLGDGFTGIKHLMLLYAPGVLLVSFFATLGNYFSALGKQRYIMYCYGLGFVFTLVFAPAFVNSFDTEGAAYVSNISYLIITLALCTAFLRSNNIRLRDFFSLRQDYDRVKRLVFPNGN